MTPLIRSAINADAQDLFGLISLCLAEYPGCFVDPHADLPDMLTPASTYAANGGAYWVIEDERGRVAACCGVDFPRPGQAELHRLYVRPDQRRAGFAGQLLAKAEALARERGAMIMILWSDTRFRTAHAFYEKRGYRRGAEPRQLDDISNSSEYFFEHSLI